MSIFGSIMSKIFGGSASAQAAAPHASETPSVSAAAQGPDGPTGSASGAAAPSMSGAPSPVVGGPAGAGQANVDVGQVLSDLASKNGQTLDYKRSIVDLLKLLDLDSSLQARKQLADELHYTGDKEDSATRVGVIWLYRWFAGDPPTSMASADARMRRILMREDAAG
ncbi:UNVERIFIED_ORG: hypothetical protein M2438_002958 [Methylobacterium sp. SuP10 SLI 274]|uniref:DUF3597 family protein n=1 Tax=Methylorubrum extorquens TaxID=408 RepID=UPI00209E9A44|nr:DUF3597 family protein [Methylorubrum extorquens]MDF9864190.1 hypothetical protein [Methylorubrum pseudosasae]MDH6637783.1 hypothetical protein [Methylobacterium sp. SuP10 SLI 274]MDH6666962.1 hypothetical protein [Methylorubrum zatmanii]MCP1558868.1 hypothetical protein [Methylorubrum extorquens]MDF9792502.1 hypothetical protein [Methylorubrum extorquens]